MSTEQTQQALFYEGQYLGQADLNTLSQYAEYERARHSLGGHTWGIAMGLDLEVRGSLSGDGTMDVYLHPGYAWDGHGRTLTNLSPLKLSPRELRDAPAGMIPVWIQYKSETAGRPSSGFERCDRSLESQSSRTQRSFRICYGAYEVADQNNGVVIGRETENPIEVNDDYSDGTGLLRPDSSIPFQCFPSDDDRHRWLIPIGYVHWQPGPLGQDGNFLELDEDQKKRHRAFRRYIGSVSESVYAADGVVRIRTRKQALPEGKDLEGFLEEQHLQYATKEMGRDLTVTDDGTVQSTDLLWVEGHQRNLGDLKMFGGKLDFRDAEGNINDIPIEAFRTTYESGADQAGTELRVVIGKEQDGKNRFALGALDGEDFAHKLVVRDDGVAGIGTEGKDGKLSHALTLRAKGDDEDLLGFENADGDLKWHINQKLNGTEGLNIAETDVADGRLFIKAGGNVGIGTTDPQEMLHIKGDDPDLALDIVSTSEKSLAELQFRLDGSVKSQLYWSKSNNKTFLRNNDKNAVVVNEDGLVGIGHSSPEVMLDIEGSVRGNQTGGALRIETQHGHVDVGPRNETWSHFDTDRDKFYFNKAIHVDSGIVSSYNEDLTLQTSSATRLTIKNGSGDVGVGTTSPATRFHVRDEIDANANDVSAHVALIENASTGTSSDVLALKIGRNDALVGTNYITFFAGSNAVGSIEGTRDAASSALINGLGTFLPGVNLGSTIPNVYLNFSGADYAEWLPRLNEDERLAPGDVIGIKRGAISKNIEGCDYTAVVSSRPVVVGNRPPEEYQDRFTKVAFLGQSAVSVQGAVRAGDVLIPSGRNDGKAIALPAEQVSSEQLGQIIGTAWQDHTAEHCGRINAAVGLTPLSVFRALSGRIDRLETSLLNSLVPNPI